MKKILLIIQCFIISILISAIFSVSVNAKTPQLGGISIQTNTYFLNEKNERSSTPKEGLIRPNDEIDYIINVENKAAKAYVRVKVDNTTEYDSSVILQDVSSDWVYTNGYFYYKNPLDNNTSVDLCTKIKIPDFKQNTNFDLTINSEAIQCVNFTPDFTKKDPWNGTKVEDGVNGDLYTTGRSFAIETDDNLANCIDKNAILLEYGNLMPGNSLTDGITIDVKNDGEIFMSCIYSGGYPLEYEYMKLKVYNENKIIYEKSLFSKDLENGISLGEYKKGDKVHINCTISLDEKLTNVSAWQELPTSFKFSQKLTIREQVEEIITRIPVKTGDIPIMIVGIICMLSIITFVIIKKGKSYEKK